MGTPEPNQPLLDNMRISFDGMIPRHQSELSHKKDTVDIFKSLLTATASLYVAVFGLTLADVIPYWFTLILIWVLFAGSIVFARNMSKTTNEKFTDDNKGYMKYRLDYLYSASLLGIDQDPKQQIREPIEIDKLKELRAAIQASDRETDPTPWKPRGGVNVTITMVNNISFAVIGFSFLGAVILSVFAIAADLGLPPTAETSVDLVAR